MEANPDAKRLYDDLLSNYNRLIRPVVNNTETLVVRLGLKLSQLIEVSLNNFKIDFFNLNFLGEFKKSGHDDKRVGGTEMDGL